MHTSEVATDPVRVLLCWFGNYAMNCDTMIKTALRTAVGMNHHHFPGTARTSPHVEAMIRKTTQKTNTKIVSSSKFAPIANSVCGKLPISMFRMVTSYESKDTTSNKVHSFDELTHNSTKCLF